MAKSAVYSWRLTPDLKLSLEAEARQNDESMAELLERITREWLERTRGEDEEAEERRLRAAALPFIGAFDGGDPDRASEARQTLRRRLAERHGRRP